VAVAGVARHAIAAAAGRIVAATAAIPSGNALVHATPLVVAAPVAAAPVAAAPVAATPVPAAAVAAPLVTAAPAVALEASATIPVRAFAAARVAVVTATPRGVFAAVMAPTTVALGLASRDEAHLIRVGASWSAQARTASRRTQFAGLGAGLGLGLKRGRGGVERTTPSLLSSQSRASRIRSEYSAPQQGMQNSGHVP
jgi:hypothetical protein